MRIDRLHELNKGDEQKKELERREQITKQLEQLAESERKQHELIAQQEMALRMKEKAVKMAVLKATQNTSNALLKRDPTGLLHSIPTAVIRSTQQVFNIHNFSNFRCALAFQILQMQPLLAFVGKKLGIGEQRLNR